MNEKKEQFDELLGGSEALPCDVHIMKLISARAGEIAAMTHSIENPQQTKLVFQKLPVHMRRRVMSHNAKRLPRRLREAHLRQMTKSGLPPKSKRPSRKYRRRPYNLLLEYNRRQRSKVWLETHIWHAKRFHMTQKWGYVLANYANDRCFKANYRAVMKHCLIQDLSYYTCIEISGPHQILKETLKTHCNPTELSFNAKVYISGNREGTLLFFRKNSYPRSPIGNVHFLWRHCEADIKTIWLWVHPAFYNDFLTEIISSFEFQEKDADSAVRSNLPEILYSNINGCKMMVMRNAINRFRLYGPLTLNVLTDALRLSNTCDNKLHGKDQSVEPMEIELDKSSCDIEQLCHSENVMSTQDSQFIEHHSNENNIEASSNIQKSVWQVLQTLQSPNQLPPNIVLAFTVGDPRFYIPNKRKKCQKQEAFSSIISWPFESISQSPIWEADVRNKVTKSCMSTKEINDLRSSCLVPGIKNNIDFSEDVIAKIPILLIQKPGNGSTGFSSSVDIVLPAGWAMPFWLSFIFRCTRVGALRESRSIAVESLTSRSPELNDPDMPAYEREALMLKTELTEKYFRYPPNRRVNFIKFGISSPFYCQWKMLMLEWSNTEDFYVLRNRRLLTHLQLALSRDKQSKARESDSYIIKKNIDDPSFEKNCLIRVKITMLRKGHPNKFALICIPMQEDINNYQRNNHWVGPVETLKTDPHEARRKKLRRNHLMLLKRYKRQRVRCRRSASFKGNITTFIPDEDTKNRESKIRIQIQKSLASTREIILAHFKKMSELYLPDCSKVRNSCEREVMGYVTSGNYSFVEAKGVAIGYVTLHSILEVISRQCDTVLVRNTQTRQYRVARLEVLSVD